MNHAQIGFTDEDADTIWFFMLEPRSLKSVVGFYEYLNRAAIPGFEEFRATLSKAQCAGIIRHERVKWSMDESWNAVAHPVWPPDDYAEDMVQFADYLTSRAWPVVSGVNYELTEQDYERATRSWW